MGHRQKDEDARFGVPATRSDLTLFPCRRITAMLAASGLLTLLLMGALAESMMAKSSDNDEDTPDDDSPDDDALHLIHSSPLGDLLFRPADDDGPPGDVTDGADSYTVTDTEDLGDGEPIACVTDFQLGIDRLILEFDGGQADCPGITFDSDSDPGSTIVMANGVPVTIVDGIVGMTQGMVVVVMLGVPVADNTGEDDDDDAPDTDDDSYVGDDLLNGGTPDDMLRARAGAASIFDGADADAITGGIGNDLVHGSSGADAIFGNEGDDTLLGQTGADEIYGDEGADRLDGGADADFLSGGDGDDTLRGGDGNDWLFGNADDDLLIGEVGNDFLQGGFGADTLEGGAGNDRLDGTFTGQSGAFGPADEDSGDLLDGGDGDDTILAGAYDTVIGGAGADSFIGGAHVQTAEAASHVLDFNPDEDRIEVMIDRLATPDPVIGVRDFDDGTGAHILLNGAVILSVTGAQGLDLASILIREVSLEPA